MLGISGLDVIHANFRFLAGVMGHRQIIAVKFGHKDAGLCAKRAGNFGKKRIVVSILLLENVEKSVARKIDAFVLCVISGIVHHSNGWEFRNHFSIVQLESNKSPWIS